MKYIWEQKEAALMEIKRGQEHRIIAAESIKRALEGSRSVELATTPDGRSEALNRLIRELKGYCREVFVATDHIQRAWGYIVDMDAMIVTMYQHLYEIYPPRFPMVFEELFSEEWKMRKTPKLL
jgi:hypothetical protein